MYLREIFDRFELEIRLALIMLVIVVIGGCGSMPPDRIAFNTVKGASETVVLSMKVFNDMYQDGHFKAADREKVLRAYADFKIVAEAAVDLGPTVTDPNAPTIRKVSAMAVEVIRLIEHFTKPAKSAIPSAGLWAPSAGTPHRLVLAPEAGGLPGPGQAPFLILVEVTR